MFDESLFSDSLVKLTESIIQSNTPTKLSEVILRDKKMGLAYFCGEEECENKLNGYKTLCIPEDKFETSMSQECIICGNIESELTLFSKSF